MHGKALLSCTILVSLATGAVDASEMHGSIPVPGHARALPLEGHFSSSFAALKPWGQYRDNRTSIGYDGFPGQIWIDGGADLTSVRIMSSAGIFTGDPALNLGGPSDQHSDHLIFKSVEVGSFRSVSFGSVAKRGLSEGFLLDDLTVEGTRADGEPFGDVDLIYIPEPPTSVLLILAVVGWLKACSCKRLFSANPAPFG